MELKTLVLVTRIVINPLPDERLGLGFHKDTLESGEYLTEEVCDIGYFCAERCIKDEYIVESSTVACTPHISECSEGNIEIRLLTKVSNISVPDDRSLQILATAIHFNTMHHFDYLGYDMEDTSNHIYVWNGDYAGMDVSNADENYHYSNSHLCIEYVLARADSFSLTIYDYVEDDDTIEEVDNTFRARTTDEILGDIDNQDDDDDEED